MKNKKIFKIMLIEIALIFIIYLGISIYKYSVLSGIQNSIDNFNSLSNYYIKVESSNGSNLENYYKDGELKTLKNGEIVNYSNETTLYSIIDGKLVNLGGSKGKYYPLSIYAKIDTEGKLSRFIISLSPSTKLSKETIDGIKCIKLEFDNNEIIYIDEQTKLPYKYKYDYETLTYTIKKEVVLDSDVDVTKYLN